MKTLHLVLRELCGEHPFLPLVGHIKWHDDSTLVYHVHIPGKLGWTQKISYRSWPADFGCLLSEPATYPGDGAPQLVYTEDNLSDIKTFHKALPTSIIVSLKRDIVADIDSRNGFSFCPQLCGMTTAEELSLLKKTLLQDIERQLKQH